MLPGFRSGKNSSLDRFQFLIGSSPLIPKKKASEPTPEVEVEK